MPLPFERASIVGLGYIGLPTAVALASRGIEVIGVDVNPNVVARLKRGEVHIVEPDLDMITQSAVQSGRLRPTTRPEPADVFVIAVPTPFKDGHKPDISYVEAAARSIAPVIAKGNLIILESTSPVGTTRLVAELFAQSRPDLTFPHLAGEAADVMVAYCPERVLPGHALRELVQNDRVIGGLSRASAARANDFYRVFVSGDCVETDARTAELVKLTENAFRDVNIAFANEMSLICDRLDIDVWELIALANRHPRVNILQPGPGVGGHCIAIDPWFIVDSTPAEARLIRTAREVNDGKPLFILDKVRAAIAAEREPVVAFLGLTFKADIDDLRESPALDIAHQVTIDGRAPVLIAEPHVSVLPETFAKLGNVFLKPPDEAVRLANIVVLLVNHRAFAGIPRSALAGKRVIDTRGLWR